MAQQTSAHNQNARLADPAPEAEPNPTEPSRIRGVDHSDHPPAIDDDCVNWGEEVLILP